LTGDPAEIAAQVDYPCVVKPLLLSGSRGVIRADNPAEFARAFARLRALLLSEGNAPESTAILVEDFIPGFEVALEGLLTDGELRVLALFDKPDPLDGPFFEETIYVTPSRLPQGTQGAIAAATARAARALGLRTGPVHAELRVNERGPWLVEISARVGHPLTPLPEGASYLGFIFARADDPATAEAALREAHARLHFAIKPEIPVLNPALAVLPPATAADQEGR